MKRAFWKLFFASPAEQAKYNSLRSDPERAATSKHFGNKAIAKAIIGMILSVLPVILAFLARKCADQAGKEWFAILGMILLLVIAAGLAVCILISLLSNFRYVRWQKNLNNLNVRAVALALNLVAVFVAIGLDVLAVLLFAIL